MDQEKMDLSKAVAIDYVSVDPDGGVRNPVPIIFLHAMLCSKEIWTTIPQTVADNTGRRVYTYDARNHGESPKTDESNFDLNVIDLFAVIEKIKADLKAKLEIVPKQFVLVGHDMGGITAIKAALKKKRDFEKVIIIEMYARKVKDDLIGRVRNFVEKWTECIKELPKDTKDDDKTKISVENLYEKLTFKKDAEKKSYLQGKFLYIPTETGYAPKYNTSALLKALDELKNQKGEYYKGTYDGPAFFIHGTESFYDVDKEEESMKKHFPNARLVAIKDGSHFLVADMAKELAEELSKAINISSRGL